MDADERDIYLYLKSWKTEFIAEREISRRAGGKNKYQEDQSWAVRAIQRMVERNILEGDGTGRYHIKPRPIPKTLALKKKFVSPEMAKILKQSGKDFSETVNLENEEDLDAYYENL